jgi:pilus assembly protein TadC
MRGNSNLPMTILLNIVGVMLVLTAILLLLRGLGWINQIPGFVIWSLVLAAVGIGIVGGVRSLR